MLFLILLVVIIGVVVLWLVVLQHKKGDFSYRIKKLQRRAATLLSDLMKMRSESDYLALSEGKDVQRQRTELENVMDEVNEKIVSITEELQALAKRAASFLDFADLYVFIGIQEEALEEAEAQFAKAKKTYKAITGDIPR